MAAAAPPRGRPVPLGTRRLGFARQKPLASAAHQTLTPGHPAQNNGLRPRAFSHTAVSKRRAADATPRRRDATFAPLTCAAAGVDRCHSALGMGHPGEKTVFVRAPGEIISDKLIVYRFDFLLRRGARGSLCTLALSARWRNLVKQHKLFDQVPTPAVARGSSYPDEQELRSGRAGPAYAAEAGPPGTR